MKFDQYYQLARQLYQNGPSHDFFHVERVFHLALRLGEIERADLEILGLAALFHDLARETETASAGEICHAVASAKQAQEIFLKHGESETKVAAIYHCIATHRYRNGNEPQTLEAKCLYDADKLDSLGAIGVARAYLWLGERGGTVYIPREIWEQTDFASNRPEEDSLQREWHIKLRHIPDKLYTSSARKLAMKRSETMKNFLETLEREIDSKE